jgi:cellobiose phosphorylase
VWDSFEAARSFRGVRYVIQVDRKGQGNKVQLEVGGNPVEGDTIPLPPNGTKEVQVKVKLGNVEK